MPKKLITYKDVTEYFKYVPDEGVMYWKKSPGGCARVGKKAGTIEKTGYVSVGFKGVRHQCTYLIWMYVYGEYPEGEIDHIDGNPSNNKLANLRLVSHYENSKNRKLNHNNSSGLSGIYLRKNTNRWDVQITVQGKTMYLGTYQDFFESCCIRKSAEIKHFYHENHGRR